MIFIAIVKVLLLGSLGFILGMSVTPLLTFFLYRYKFQKNVRSDISKTPIVAKLHAHKKGIPTMGGIIIWAVVLFFAVSFYYASKFIASFPQELNFLTRRETLLPIGVFIASALVGLVDDFFNVKQRGPGGGGLKIRERLIIYTLIAIVGAYWFYAKLEWNILHLPFYGNVAIGWWIVPIFIFTIVATSFSVNETDGLDGLAGGILLSSFSAYTAVAFIQGRYNLASFCAIISGALLAFLWFNIHPARFIMGDTGSMSLGVTLGVVAMLTNTIWLLPFIGSIMVIESTSVILQMISKKYFRKKIFLSTPVHHHFEARGWSEPKVVMRFWIISAVTTAIGLIVFLFDRLLTT